jgi:hypothetical protein
MRVGWREWRYLGFSSITSSTVRSWGTEDGGYVGCAEDTSLPVASSTSIASSHSPASSVVASVVAEVALVFLDDALFLPLLLRPTCFP